MKYQGTYVFVILTLTINPLKSADPQLSPDLINGVYKMETFIKKGGCGSVFQGRDLSNQQLVAIKIELSGPPFGFS